MKNSTPPVLTKPNILGLTKLGILGMLLVMAVMTSLVAMAAVQGSFRTSLVWNKYTDTNAAGLKVYLGNEPGLYTTNFTLPGITATNLLVDVQPGKTYYATIVAYAGTGTNVYESVPATEVSWNTPADLSTPEGFAQKVTIYIK